MLQDSKRAVIRRDQGPFDVIHPEKDMAGRLESGINTGRDRAMVNYRHGFDSTQNSAQIGHKIRGWRDSRRRGRSQTVARQTKMSPVEEVRRRAAGVLADRGTEAEEDKGKMIHPAPSARGAGPGNEAVLQSPVLPLYHSITLGVVGGSLEREIPSMRHSSSHSPEVNCRPRSVTIEAGTPKREIQ